MGEGGEWVRGQTLFYTMLYVLGPEVPFRVGFDSMAFIAGVGA